MAVENIDLYLKRILKKTYIQPDIKGINEYLKKVPKEISIAIEFLSNFLNNFDLDKFRDLLNHKYKIKPVKFDIESFIMNKYKLEGREILSPLFQNLERVLSDPEILGFKDKTNSDISFTDSDLKTSIKDIFYVMRISVKSNSKLYDKINDRYEQAILNFILAHLPYQYYDVIIMPIEILRLIIQSTNIKKLFEQSAHLRFTTEIKAEQIVNALCCNDAEKKYFIMSLIGKLSPIIDSLSWIFMNLSLAMKNINVILDDDDEIFM